MQAMTLQLWSSNQNPLKEQTGGHNTGKGKEANYSLHDDPYIAHGR